MRHSRTRDAEAIHHHYDVSNAFYEYVLGPSMTYTCAVFPTEDATLEQAQYYKYDLVARKLDLKPGMRLLDVGCGWGGMVRHAAEHYGVKALGVTLSREQATWAQEKIKEMGLDHLAEVRHSDYREVTESGFDAVSSIGLTEHIGVRNYPSYFALPARPAAPAGPAAQPLHHPAAQQAPGDRRVHRPLRLPRRRADRVGPDHHRGAERRPRGACTRRTSGSTTPARWPAGARTSQDNWDACVAEVGEGTARVWGLYMAGSRLAFERNEIQLHHVLAVKTDDLGHDGYPLRPTFPMDATLPRLTA